MRLTLLAAVALALFGSGAAQAAIWNVNTTVDTDDGTCNVANCTLREAVNAAATNPGSDSVVVPAGTYQLFAGPLSLSGANANSTSIFGDGARTTIISGRGVSRVLFNSSLAAGLNGLTIRDGFDATEGGGIANWGSMSLTNVTVTGNVAGTTTQPGNGGGILVDFGGLLTVTGSTISGNTAAGGGQGGGLYQTAQLGDPDSNGTLTGTSGSISNSTLSGNTAGSGGAIATGISGTSFGSSSLSITRSTLAANSATAGSAIFRQQSGTGPVGITALASIVSGTCSGTVGNSGASLDANSSCGFGTFAPLHLEPLANNGGPTDTHALGDGSGAIDAAGACIGDDQRGRTRPFGPGCDVGAYEAGAGNLAVAIADSPDPVAVGAPLAYTVTVTNPGESALENVQAFVALPGAASPQAVSASSGNCTLAAIVVCSLGRVGRGANVVITVNVVAPPSLGMVTASATVSGLGTDSDPADNAAAASTTVADLAAPAGSLAFKARYPLGRTLARGLAGSFAANEAAAATAVATVTKKMARRYRLKKTTVATGGAALAAAGTSRLNLRFTREARRKLGVARSIVVTIRVVVTDPFGNATAMTKKTTLRR